MRGPAWLRTQRRAAASRFAAGSLPTDALEEWRYSRIDALDLDGYQPAPPPDPGGAPPAIPDLEAILAALGSGLTVVETRDGHVTEVAAAGGDVTVDVLSEPDATEADLGAVSGEPDAFTALNLAFAPAPVRVRIARGAVSAPVVLVHRVETDSVAVFPRVLVDLGEGADASVLEVVAGPGAALVVPVTELVVGPTARLRYLHLQVLGLEAWQLAVQASRVAKDASLVAAAVALGGDYARLRADSALVGPGADGRLLAVYFAAAHQMHDFRTVQHHRAPKTRSDLLYKGAVANSARSVYSGLIRVEKGAAGTNAMQTNRNLILHQGAHADSVPNLEIEDNDVRCSHASAVGPIAEDQHFYLESRGVPPDAADRLIALGFLDEVLGQLPLPALVDTLRWLLAAKLDAADSAEKAAHPQAGVSIDSRGEG